MSFGEFAEHTLEGYYTTSSSSTVAQPAAAAGSDDAPARQQQQSSSDVDDIRHVPGTPDYPPSPSKDVAPAAVHLAAAAAGRQFAQLMITHD